jgi:hypothetical protein
MPRAKQAGASSTPRTEVFGLRMDPKLKYVAELAARKQRRSLAGYVEWAIEEALRKTALSDGSSSTAWEESGKLWDLSPARRFVRLASRHRDLLSFDEQKMLWTLENVVATDPKSKDILSFKTKTGYDENGVERCWDAINAYARSDEPDGPRLEAAMITHLTRGK